MSAIPLLTGCTASASADFNLSYPVNLEPVPLKSGLSEGYLRSAPGATQFGEGPGIDRGGIDWSGVLYRVMGTKLVSVSSTGAVTVIGDVGDGGPVAMDYGFSLLAINSGTALWYWDGTTLTQVTDPDLGQVFDMLWFTGYYVTTDGTSIIVTQLADPFAVDPLKYGSAEEDPDMIEGLFKLRGELYALGRYTIQPFSNTGGSGFPFTANTAGTVPVGICGPRAKCEFYQTLAFTGSGKGEATAVYLLDGGSARKISTRTIDDALAEVADQSSITMESRMSRDERRLLIHLPDKTLIYMANASRLAGQPVWYIAASGTASDQQYRLQNAVLCYGRWICGDTASANLGVLDESISTQFGDVTGWQFDTQFVYNQSKAAITHSLELVGLPGRAPLGTSPVAFMSTSLDGETWSMERACSTGARGNRGRRVQWRPHKRFPNYMSMRFRGASEGVTGWAALNAEAEPLNV